MKQTTIVFLVLSFLILLQLSCSKQEILKGHVPSFDKKTITMTSANALALAEEIPNEVALEVHEGLEIALWASDSLIKDPIAISIDPQGGIYYTSATRISNSEFDIRGHRNWMTASISFQSVEDRRKFLRETFSEENEEGIKFLKDLNEDGTLDWRDLAVQKEQIWRLADTDDDGVADKAELYLEDFNEEITDVANGVLHHGDDVYVAAGPHLSRTKDTDGDGFADHVEAISSGYAVHIGFGGHGMSGVTVGPAGRIWWGIGDIGANIIDQTGKRWKYPNRGVVVRSEPDGSNFEVFCMGVRNTHEFVFDKYGNLITEDNDGDHQGERERLVYLVDGSDTGWRINWQFGKYTDPDNNNYKVWMDEKMNIPHWEGQAAYFIPPIQNYVNGPTGMVYNPGTALSPQWYDHFFIAEFRGSPANSPIHAFKMKPNGASFELDTTMIVVKGTLPTGLDFGPDGALYYGDWIDGWGSKEAGRLWKLDVPGGAQTAIRKEVKGLIESDFSEFSIDKLDNLLAHQDLRIRRNAQLELAKRPEGKTVFTEALRGKNAQLKRIHGVWGLAQLARKDNNIAAELVSHLDDNDAEIISQCAKYIGDVKHKGGSDKLTALVNHPYPRIQFFATEALGRQEHRSAADAIIQMLEKNNDKDLYLRHAGILALSRIGDADLLIGLKDSNSKALRTAAVVALRRMDHAGVAEYLKDSDDYIVAEAARAINDDYSIIEALPALADLLSTTTSSNEVIIRRAINANLRVGNLKNLQQLTDYTLNQDAPEAMRAEAIATLSTWHKPSVLDRVDGRYRGEINRDKAELDKVFASKLNDLIKDKSQSIKMAAMVAAGKMATKSMASEIQTIFENSTSSKVRKSALQSLAKMAPDNLADIIASALQDKSYTLRSEALKIIPESSINDDDAVALYKSTLDREKSNVREKQAALVSLMTIKSEAVKAVLLDQFAKMQKGELSEKIQLELLDAMEAQGDNDINEVLKSYYAQYSEDPLGEYLAALDGGDGRNGREIFFWNDGAQCVRCHSIYEWGGGAGPSLHDVGEKLTKREILMSMVYPSASYADGYQVASLKLKDDTTVAGYIKKESGSIIGIEKGDGTYVEVSVADVAERTDIPSSMPDMKKVLTKSEMRDLVEYLSGLKIKRES